MQYKNLRFSAFYIKEKIDQTERGSKVKFYVNMLLPSLVNLAVFSCICQMSQMLAIF